MQLDPESLSTRDMYLWLVQVITPRPIAWVSTMSRDGVANLAPFSFFNGVGANPPTVMFCPANNRDGGPKDTLANIQQTGEFAVNLVSFGDASAMNNSAAEYAANEDEFDLSAVRKLPCDKIAPPRVADAPVALECELHTAMQIGTGPGGANLVIGRIVAMHIEDRVLDDSGKVDPAKFDLIGRMGGSHYIRTGDIDEGANPSLFSLPRPPRPN